MSVYFNIGYTTPQWLSDKESACNAGDVGLIPGLGRSPPEGDGNPLQYSCLENPMDRGIWWATVPGVERVGHDCLAKQQQYTIHQGSWGRIK